MIKYFLSLILLAVYALGSAQTVELPKTPSVVPTSPNTAALMKAVEFPVNTATGTAGINIPLTSLTSANINVPVSISYNSSGIRVTEEASSVGLGWALNAGGRISRVIQGIPDGATYSEETLYGAYFLSMEDSVASPSTYYMHNVNRGVFDSQYDLYNYNFNGHSGTFIVKKTSDNGNATIEYSELSALSIPESDVKIDILGIRTGAQDGVQITSFRITTSDGLVYLFGDTANTDFIEETLSKSGQGSLSRNYISSWLLKSINTPNNSSNEVSFTYDNDVSYEISYLNYDTYKNLIEQVDLQTGGTLFCATNSSSYSKPYNVIQQKRISKIESPTQRIDFLYESGRTDFPGAYRLSEVETYAEINGSWVSNGKEVALDNDHYFGSNGALNERLKLNSVSIGNMSANIPKYTFDYNTHTDLPPKNSYAQDHWGYYNGKTTNNTLVPATNVNGIPVAGANRSPSYTHAKAAILEKVYYPTGGFTEFIYGQNTVNGSGENILIDHSSSLSVINPPGEEGEQNPQTDEEVITISQGYPLIFDNIIIDASSTEFPSDKPGIIIENLATSEIISYTSLSDQTYGYTELDLDPGDYKITARIRFEGSSVSASYHWQEDTGLPLLEKEVPGLRIEKVTKSTNDNSELAPMVTRYVYENDQGYSSGLIFESGDYSTYNRTVTDYYFWDQQGNPVGGYGCKCLVRNSSYLSLTNSGVKMGYSQVTTLNGNAGEYGKATEKYYYPDHLYPNIFTPQLKEKNIFRWSNAVGQFEAKTTENRNYVSLTDEGLFYDQVSVVQTTADYWHTTEPGLRPNVQDTYTAEHFALLPRKRELASIETHQYDDSGNELVTTQNFGYGDNHFYPIIQTTTASEGATDQFETIFRKYPLDYTSTASSGIQSMQTHNLISVPIEEQLWKGVGTDSTLVNGVISDYNLLGQPKEVSQLRTSSPLNSLDDETNTGGLFDTEISDSHYQSEFTNSFDSRGNLLKTVKHTGETIHFLWGYDNTAVTAVIQNANINEFAYTSFENDTDKGGWTYGGANYPAGANGVISGEKKYLLQAGSITKSGLPTGTYILSFYVGNVANLQVKLNGVAQTPDMQNAHRNWSKVSIELPITSGSDVIEISGDSGDLDELRLHPPDATMRTYAHNPVYGVISETDENGVSKFYSYDDLGRLERITDEDLNTVKILKYNYRQN